MVYHYFMTIFTIQRWDLYHSHKLTLLDSEQAELGKE